MLAGGNYWAGGKQKTGRSRVRSCYYINYDFGLPGGAPGGAPGIPPGGAPGIPPGGAPGMPPGIPPGRPGIPPGAGAPGSGWSILSSAS